MRRLNGDAPQGNAQVVRQPLGVGNAALRRVAGWHRHADHIIDAQGIGGNDGGQRRVHAAGEAYQGFAKPGFADIIARASNQRLIDLASRVGQWFGQRINGRAGKRFALGSLSGRGKDGGGGGIGIGIGAAGNPAGRRCGFAEPGIAQPMAQHCAEFQVGDNQCLGKGRPSRQQAAVGAADDAAAVKHQLILPAYGVEVGHENAVVGGAGGNHPRPLARLAGVVGGGINVDDNGGAGIPLGGNGAFGIPDVLADVDANQGAVDGTDASGIAPPEVAFLVKHAVVGQVNLAIPAGNAPRPDAPRSGAALFGTTRSNQGGGVGNIIADGNAADDDGNIGCGGGDAPDGGGVVSQKGGFEQQILRGVAGYGQFGEGHQVGGGGAGFPDEGDDALGIAGNIADGGVELGQGQAEGARHHHNGAYYKGYRQFAGGGCRRALASL